MNKLVVEVNDFLNYEKNIYENLRERRNEIYNKVSQLILERQNEINVVRHKNPYQRFSINSFAYQYNEPWVSGYFDNMDYFGDYLESVVDPALHKKKLNQAKNDTEDRLKSLIIKKAKMLEDLNKINAEISTYTPDEEIE